MRQDPLEITYKLRVRQIFVIVLISLSFAFYLLPKIEESKISFEDVEQTEIIIVEIPHLINK